MKKFQRFRIGAVALSLLGMLLGVCLAADQSVVMVNLTQPIEANKSNSATAKFSELTQEAMKYGMADAYISGQVEYSMQSDKTIRSNIKWTAISIENASKKVTEGLEQTLSSAFRVPESSPRAEPGTKLKAYGDIDALAVSLGKLKAQLDAQSTPVQKETTNTKNQTQAVSPTVQAQDNNQDKYLADSGTPFNTVVEAGTQTSYVACDDYFVDIASMKAVKQYKPVYTQNGVQTGEGICAPNFSEFYPIQSQEGTCTYRFDFQNSTAAKQQQLYYMNGATEIPVGGCRDSDTTYPLYESRTGCSVTMDLANAKAFPTSKLAFKVGAVEMNATECRAVAGTTGIDLQEEACEPMWEHDFVNNVSYLVTRIYYIDDQTGQKVYASQCGRSTKVSYPHVIDTTGCGWIMDDEHMLARQQGKTIIKTGAVAGDVVIQDCHTVATLNYTYIGAVTQNHKITANGSFAIPAGSVSTSVLLIGRGAVGALWYDPQDANNNCNCGAAGLPGTVSIYDFGNSTGVINIVFDQGTGTYPGNTVMTFNGKTYTALSGGSEPLDGSHGICPPPEYHAGTVNSNGYTTTGRFGIMSSADYPRSGGCGWGAGGLGSTSRADTVAACMDSPNTAISFVVWPYTYVRGAPGVAIVEYKINSYMRPDGTTYIPGT